MKIVVLKAGDMVIFTGYLRLFCTHGVVRMQSETQVVLPTNLHDMRKVVTLRFKAVTKKQEGQWWRFWAPINKQ